MTALRTALWKGLQNMEDKSLLRVLRWLALGIAVAVGGLFFAGLCGSLLNGMEFGDAACLGIGLYLCIVVVVCTGAILSRIQKREATRDGKE